MPAPVAVRWILASPVLAIVASCMTPAAMPLDATTPRAALATASEIDIVSPPIEGFYGKRLRDSGIPILAHVSVSDEALFAARDRLRRILEHAPKIRRNLETRGHELHLVGLRQFTSDLPEHRDQRGKRLESGELFDWHMIGGHIVGNLSSCTEATLLPIVGHRLFGTEPCIHELAHAVDLRALDNATRGRIHQAYQRSMAAGRWKNQYAAKNEREWFAELTRYYFLPDSDALAFYDQHAGHGREWLRREDPEGFELVDGLYSGRIDPGVPRTRPLPLGPAGDEARLRSPRSHLPSELTVHNGTTEVIRLVWIDFEGKRDPRLPFERMPSASPGGTITTSSWAGHTFVITDATGRGLCTLIAAEEDGIVDLKGPCP